MIKLADTLAPMADFPAVMAEHTAFEDGETLQEKYETGQLGGGGGGYTQLSQAEYDALTDDEKMDGREYRTYDTGHVYKLGIEYGKDTDLSGTLVTYTSIGDLNTRKGLSISLVANEDNTQTLIDALDAKEQFVDWFGNSNDRFGINPKTYGSRINEFRITKMTNTDASVIAIMNSGAVLGRVYTGGVLEDWTSVGHILTDGYTDDGTISITGQNEDNSGMYGNGVLPETLGFTRDVMTWDNGCYKISHGVDLTNTPDGLQAGRLEHFNLKRWGSNHKPHTQTWAERMSIWYGADGNVYTRLQTSGATAGVITTDTGWRRINQNSQGLVTNAQNFKIDLTKNNAYWYGMFTFSFVYGTTPCEITVTITDNVYYTITKGQNVVSAITYTQDGANYTIGIDLTAKIYGTQVVEMPSEFGTINSLTAETYAGDTTANLKLDSARTYTTLAELGLDNTATIDDVRGAIPVGGTCIIRTDAFADLTQFNGVQWGYLKITVTANKMSDIWLNDVTSNEALYYGRQSSGKFDKWVKIITDKSDPYACTSYTALTGTEDLFTLPCGHYVSANINTTYNYPITDSSNVTAHIYVLGCLNEPANNKGYRIILYFDNKNRMYRINEWWGSFSNGWKEIATKDYIDSKIADLQAQINALK